MFIAGFIVIIISILSIVGALSAKKRGDIKGASVGLFGKIGIVIGVMLLVGSGVRIIGPGEVRCARFVR